MIHNKVFVITTLLTLSFLTMMTNSIMAPALPYIYEHFAITESASILAVKVSMTLPALFLAISAPFMGWYMDKWGRKKLLCACLLGYSIAGGIGFYVQSVFQLMVARAFLGISAAGISTGVSTLVGDYFKGEEREQVASWQTAASTLSGLFFMTCSGYLAGFSWRAIFLLYLFAFILLLPTGFFLRDLVIKSKSTSFSQIRVEKTKKKTIFQLAFIDLLMFIAMGVIYVIPVQIPFVLLQFPQITFLHQGFILSLGTFFSGITSLSYKKMHTYFSHITIYFFSFCCIGLAYIQMALFSAFLESVFVLMFLGGIGFGLCFSNSVVWTLSLSSNYIRARSIGALSMMLFFGQFVAPFIAHPIQKNLGVTGPFLVLGIFLLVGAAILWVYRLQTLSTNQSQKTNN